jgi:hypothetical protein
MGIQLKSLSVHLIVFVGLLILPAALTQTMWPLISHGHWEDLSDAIFPILTTFKSTDTTKTSSVIIIKVGKDSATKLDSTIDRSNFIGLLGQLKEAGHPYVLSLMQFPALKKTSTAENEKDSGKLDKSWIQAVSSYGKFIGSPLELIDSGEIENAETEALLSLVSFTKDGTTAANIGSQPIQIVEPADLVKAEKTFGFKASFDTDRTVNCFQPYIGDAYGDLAIPTSLLWAAAFSGQANMVLGNGAVWPRKGEKVEFSFKRRLDIQDRQCVANPNLTTSDLLTTRGISEIELSDALSSDLPDLKGKIVILATDDGVKYKGPGSAASQEDTLATDYQLTARFLDGILSGDTLRRPRLLDQKHLNWMPIMIALILATTSFFFGTTTLVGLSAISFAILIGHAVIQLTSQNLFSIPIQSIASTFLATIGVLLGQILLKFYGTYRIKAFRKNLDENLAKCVDLEEIVATSVGIARKEFQVFELDLSGYNKAVYHAASSLELSIKYLNEFGADKMDSAEKKFGNEGGRYHTVLTTVKRPPDAGRLALGSRGITAKIAINSGDRRIGTAEVLLSYKSHEELFVADMINAFQQQLSSHWGRVDIAIRNRLLALAKQRASGS